MIIYDLKCSASHHFEGWFTNADEYKQQQLNGLLTCPVCGSENIQKIPSATINKSSLKSDVSNTAQTVEQQERHQVLKMFNEYINRHFDDVGNQFAEQAKKMHYGEIEERNIRGTATRDEIKELREEGVSAVQLPPSPYDKDKLN